MVLYDRTRLGLHRCNNCFRTPQRDEQQPILKTCPYMGVVVFECVLGSFDHRRDITCLTSIPHCTNHAPATFLTLLSGGPRVGDIPACAAGFSSPRYGSPMLFCSGLDLLDPGGGAAAPPPQGDTSPPPPPHRCGASRAAPPTPARPG